LGPKLGRTNLSDKAKIQWLGQMRFTTAIYWGSVSFSQSLTLSFDVPDNHII